MIKWSEEKDVDQEDECVTPRDGGSRIPQPTGKKVPEGFSYSSGNNSQWLTVPEIQELLKTVDLEK